MRSFPTDAVVVDPCSPSGLRWARDQTRARTGAVAGSMCGDGYWSVCAAYISQPTHHVVWFITHGYWAAMLDHIDGNRSNNAAANLREATHSQNMRNRLMPARDLPQGVTRSRNKFRGGVEVDGVRCRRTFDTVAQASTWVQAKRLELHGEFACTRNSTLKRKSLLSN